MKKAVYIGILVVAIIISFIVGMLVSNDNKSNNDVVGVYTTDSWNGKTGTLVLYEDGTCQYPSGGNATWVLSENSILITIHENSTLFGTIKKITVHFDDTLSDEEIKAIGNSFLKMENVKSAYYVAGDDKTDRQYQIVLAVAETGDDEKTSAKIAQIDGVRLVETFPDEANTSEHEAKIMENGLVLHGQFFKKVSD